MPTNNSICSIPPLRPPTCYCHLHAINQLLLTLTTLPLSQFGDEK
uniref:Uncharacterized protein n=1 Tax=Arundo donax TaxID=35708 RepID=A0A0A9CMK2_ARUDO